jgi:hypothetical protein
MILEQEIPIGLSGGNVSYYEELGYHLPRTINKYGNNKNHLSHMIFRSHSLYFYCGMLKMGIVTQNAQTKN